MLRLGFLFTVEDRDLVAGDEAQARAGHGDVAGEGGRGHHMMPLVRYWKPS